MVIEITRIDKVLNIYLMYIDVHIQFHVLINIFFFSRRSNNGKYTRMKWGRGRGFKFYFFDNCLKKQIKPNSRESPLLFASYFRRN